jgi:hypothetical protein
VPHSNGRLAYLVGSQEDDPLLFEHILQPREVRDMNVPAAQLKPRDGVRREAGCCAEIAQA